MDDIRNTIFKPISKQTVTATVLVEQPGILSGCDAATAEAGNMGLSVLEKKSDRDPVQIGERILRISGTPDRDDGKIVGNRNSRFRLCPCSRGQGKDRLRRLEKDAA